MLGQAAQGHFFVHQPCHVEVYGIYYAVVGYTTFYIVIDVIRLLAATVGDDEFQPRFVVGFENLALPFRKDCFALQAVAVQDGCQASSVGYQFGPRDGLVSPVSYVESLAKVKILSAEFADRVLHDVCTAMIDDNLLQRLSSHSFRHSAIPSAMLSRLSVCRAS